MQSAAKAYGTIAKQTASPRDLEASLLLKAAAQLQSVKDNWDKPASDLDKALLFNRKLWMIFVSAATDKDSPLPQAVRENIANLGMFVFKQTLAIQGKPAAEKLGSLININREVALGLRAAM